MRSFFVLVLASFAILIWGISGLAFLHVFLAFTPQIFGVSPVPVVFATLIAFEMPFIITGFTCFIAAIILFFIIFKLGVSGKMLLSALLISISISIIFFTFLFVPLQHAIGI